MTDRKTSGRVFTLKRWFFRSKALHSPVKLKTIFSIVLFLMLPNTALAEEKDLAHLRERLAISFLEPEPHLELAKYFSDHDEKLTALYILEDARRRFGNAQFDPVFRRIFPMQGAPEDSSQAEERLLRVHKEDPSAVETIKDLVKLYASRKDWQKAKKYLQKAIELRPDDFSQISTLAVIYQQEGDLQNSETVMREFAEKYPKSQAAYQARISKLIEKEPSAAKQLLEEALEAFPSEGLFHFQLALLIQFLEKEKGVEEAERHLLQAAAFAPHVDQIQGGIGRFYMKVKGDKVNALKYYLNAYFLSPHFYDGEFAESRILKLNWELSEAEFQRLLREKVGLEEILKRENSVIVGLATEKLSDPLEQKYVNPLLSLMAHDNPNIRWAATEALRKHVDRTFDPQLKELLIDPDLRKRGLSFYIAVHLWGSEGVAQVKEFLNESAQLLRYDALFALMLYGGKAGREVLMEHRTKETHPFLKKVLEAVE